MVYEAISLKKSVNISLSLENVGNCWFSRKTSLPVIVGELFVPRVQSSFVPHSVNIYFNTLCTQ